jgi:drug/metabolite transporter (DMT)-like permease
MLATLLPFLFALLWASSYIGAKVGLADITPFAYVAVRLTLAAIAMPLILRLAGFTLAPARGRIIHLMIGGALVHGLSLTTAHAALLTVGATPLALVHAFHPVLTAALGVVLLNERFRWWQWLGVALGFVGVAFGVPLSASAELLLLMGLSLFGLTAGTLYLKRFCPTVPPFPATAVQLIGGALLAIAATALFETPHARITPSLLGAMAWNIGLMSIFGMALYNIMLERYGAGRAASGFFIVPGASALMALALIGEHISLPSLIGLAASTVGVALVWWRGEAPVAPPPVSS